jgi:hypothetical protein
MQACWLLSCPTKFTELLNQESHLQEVCFSGLQLAFIDHAVLRFAPSPCKRRERSSNLFQQLAFIGHAALCTDRVRGRNALPLFSTIGIHRSRCAVHPRRVRGGNALPTFPCRLFSTRGAERSAKNPDRLPAQGTRANKRKSGAGL